MSKVKALGLGMGTPLIPSACGERADLIPMTDQPHHT